MAIPRLNIYNVFSSILIIIIGEISQTRAKAVKTDLKEENGEDLIKKIAHGEKLTENPGYLVFTAPYRLCEGGCDDIANNFAFAFPVYVGKKGVQKYKSLYPRDHENLHANDPNAPFKKKTTRHPFTLCHTTARTTTTTPTTTTTTPSTTTTTTTPSTTTTTTTPTTTTTTTTTTPTTTTSTPFTTTTTETPTETEEMSTCPPIKSCRRKSLSWANFFKLDYPVDYVYSSSGQKNKDAEGFYDDHYVDKEKLKETRREYIDSDYSLK